MEEQEKRKETHRDPARDVRELDLIRRELLEDALEPVDARWAVLDAPCQHVEVLHVARERVHGVAVVRVPRSPRLRAVHHEVTWGALQRVLHRHERTSEVVAEGRDRAGVLKQAAGAEGLIVQGGSVSRRSEALWWTAAHQRRTRDGLGALLRP